MDYYPLGFELLISFSYLFFRRIYAFVVLFLLVAVSWNICGVFKLCAVLERDHFVR